MARRIFTEVLHICTCMQERIAPVMDVLFSERVQWRGLDDVADEQRLQKLDLLNLAKRKIKDCLMAAHVKSGYNGDRVKLFSVAAGDTPKGNGHGLWFRKFRFNIREKLLP